MINFRSSILLAATAICLMACGSGKKDDKVVTQQVDSISADSTNVDSMANGTGGGMPRDIPTGTGTETDEKKTDTATKKGKWPSQQGNPM